MTVCISYADQENPKVFEWPEEAGDAGYGDILLTGPECVRLYMHPREIVKVLRRDFPDLCDEINKTLIDKWRATGAKRDYAWDGFGERVYSAFCNMALPLTLYTSTQPENGVTEMTDTKAPEQKAVDPKTAPKPAGEPKAVKAKEPKPPKEKRVERFASDAKISFLADKSGKKYGPDNSPKREGSAARKLWNLYKEGMTVKAFLDAGGTTSALKWDTDRSFIRVG